MTDDIEPYAEPIDDEDYEPDEYDPEAAYADDLAAQNAVEDAKYDEMMPEQDEPPEGYYDTPTHYQLAEDGINALDSVEFGSRQLSEEIALIQAHATLAMADQLADVLSLLKQERNRESYAERVAREAIVELDAKRAALGTIWQARGPWMSEFYMDRETAEKAAEAAYVGANPGHVVEWHTDSGGRSWTLCLASGAATSWGLLMHEVRESPNVRADVDCPF